jgi:ubiquitin C-terminal hydrolase
MEDTSSNPQPINAQPLEKDPNVKGVVGILNMGNTCYSNSVMQLLRTCSEWNAYCAKEDFIGQFKNKEQTKSIRILLAYQDINNALWSSYKPAVIRPAGFISEIKKVVKGTVYESFGIPIPNDSHEFLVFLLDNFHEALKKEVSYVGININDDMTELDKMRALAENGWNQFMSKNCSEIVQLFFGMIRKTIQCTNCKNKSYQWEIFNSLKIPCEGESFIDWIKNELKEANIEDYNCDNCKSKCTANIYSHIWKLPKNLFITLRRFNPNGHKNTNKPLYNCEPISLGGFFAEESCDESMKWFYELRGISDHRGSHMGGHYTAQFKHPVSGEWWWIDDEHSQKIDSPRILNANYIYFFRKC